MLPWIPEGEGCWQAIVLCTHPHVSWPSDFSRAWVSNEPPTLLLTSTSSMILLCAQQMSLWKVRKLFPFTKLLFFSKTSMKILLRQKIIRWKRMQHCMEVFKGQCLIIQEEWVRNTCLLCIGEIGMENWMIPSEETQEVYHWFKEEKKGWTSNTMVLIWEC